jgi:hypothetical protein
MRNPQFFKQLRQIFAVVHRVIQVELFREVATDGELPSDAYQSNR